MEKTQAMRLLEGKGIPYEAVTYPAEERNATNVAEHLGVPAAQVFKTLVVLRAQGKPFLALVPADGQLNLKKMAKAVSEKKLKMATHAEAEELTGLEVGGISPLALLNRGFDLVVDRSVQAYEQVFMSAGQKGINMKVPVREFMELTGAKCLDIAEYPDVEEG